MNLSPYKPSPAEVLARLTTTPPLAISSRPGVFRVFFTPVGLMPVVGPNGVPERVEFRSAEVWVDADAGTVVHHKRLTPMVDDLTDHDIETKAVELVRQRDRANDGLNLFEILKRSVGR